MMKIKKSALSEECSPKSYDSLKGVVFDDYGKIALVKQEKGGEVVYSLPGGGAKKKDGSLEKAFQREVLEEGGIQLKDIKEEYALRVKKKLFGVLSGKVDSINPEKISLTSAEIERKLELVFKDVGEAVDLISKKQKTHKSRDRDLQIIQELAAHYVEPTPENNLEEGINSYDQN